MTLINFPECSKQVSDKAETCPNCAYPMNKNIKSKETLIAEKKRLLAEKKKALEDILRVKKKGNILPKKSSPKRTLRFVSIAHSPVMPGK